MSAHEEGSGRGDPAPEADQPSLWRNGNFLRFFVGQFVTNAGDSLYAVAILWLVFELSGSSALVGVANSLLLLPYLLQAVAGPIVDRFDARRLLIATQLLQGAAVLVVPLAATTGHLSVALLLALIPALALASLLVAPARATLVPRILPEGQLSRGNSALATVTLGLDMLFDALGGAVVAVFGATTLFLLDSLTFAVAAALFAGMVVPTVDGGDGDTGESALRAYVADMRAGVGILRGTLFPHLILATAVANFAVGVTLATLPAFGASLGGPALYGLMLGALGVGRLVGSVVAPYLEGVPYGRLTVATYPAAALLWFGSAYAPLPLVTVAAFGLAWVPPGVNGVLTSTLNQKVFPADSLGRVSAIKGTASGATLPLGSLVGGFVAEAIGPRTTVALAAGGFGFVGLYFLVRPSLRGLPSMDDVGPAALGVETDAPPAAEGSD